MVTRAKSKEDDGLYSADVDWFLTCRDAACGWRSSLGGQIATIERGGVYNTASPDPYSEDQCDVGKFAHGSFARDRKMLKRWRKLTRRATETMVVYYLAWAPSDAGPAVDDKGNLHESRRKFPPGFEGQFGRFSGVVMWQSDAKQLDKLIKAAADAAKKGFENRKDGKVEAALKRAETAVREAHNEYWEIVAEEISGPKESKLDIWQEIEAAMLRITAIRETDGVWRQKYVERA